MSNKYATVMGALMLVLSSSTGAIASPHRVSSGQPNLQREGWSSFRAVTVGTVLRNGDLLEALDSTAAVSCDGSRKLRLTPRQIVSVTKLCGSQRLSLRGDSSDDTPIAGGNNASIPYVISPRTQWQLEATNFPIRWNPITNAQRYTVSLYCISDDGNCEQNLIWTKSTTANVITYDGAPLQPGFKYQIVVETDNGLSSLDDAADNLAFALYDPTFRDLIETDYQKLQEQEFTDEALVLALADYAITYDLYSQAIATLEARVKSGTTVIAVHQMLARLYAQTGLNLMAKDVYQQAIELAEAQDDPDALALSQKGLAKVELQLGDQAAAKQLFLAALSNYESLGDTQMTQEVQTQLAKLN